MAHLFQTSLKCYMVILFLVFPVVSTFPNKLSKVSNFLLEVCQSSCKNGQCVSKTGQSTKQYNIMCQCFEGYKGKFCEEYACNPSCKQGTCVSHLGRRVCECKKGFSGIDCNNVNWNTVLGLTGKPNAVPAESVARLMASKANRRAPRCAQNFVCQNGGYCTVFQLGVRCECPYPYTGTFCQHRCDKKCENGGVCYLNNGSPVCTCPWGYGGEYCQITST